MEYNKTTTTGKETKKPKDIKQITTGPIKAAKKPFHKKIADVFIGDESDNIGSYIVYDVIVPAIKSMVTESVTNGISMLMGGGTDNSRRGTSSNRYSSYNNRTPYSTIYRANDPAYSRSRDHSSANRARHGFDDIFLDSKHEADEVIDCLCDLIDDYQVASIADYYTLVGVKNISGSDNKYGWSNLAKVSVSKTRDGYIINLPKPEPID